MNRLKTLFSGKSQKKRNRRQKTLSRSLALEGLESRQMLAVAFELIPNPVLGTAGDQTVIGIDDSTPGQIAAPPGAILAFALVVETDADVNAESIQLNIEDGVNIDSFTAIQTAPTAGGFFIQDSDPDFTPVNGGPFSEPVTGDFANGFVDHWFKAATDFTINPSAGDDLGSISIVGGVEWAAGDRIPVYAFTVEVPPLNQSLTIDFSTAGGGAFRTVVTDGGNNGAAIDVTSYGVVTITGSDLGPTAVDDTVAGTEDTTAVIPIATLTANDARFDTFDSVNDPTNGTVSIQGANVEFVPTPNFSGAATFDYQITGGGTPVSATVTVNVAAVNDPPVATDDTAQVTAGLTVNADVLGNDSDIDGGALVITAVDAGVINGSSITYDAAANSVGDVVVINYTVSDGNSGTDTGVLTIDVVANQAPVTSPDGLAAIPEDSTTGGTILETTLISNDVDPEFAGNANECPACVIVTINDPPNGTITDNGNGSWTYIPDADFSGNDVFTYVIDDGNGNTSTGTITAMVVGANDAPIAVDDNPMTSRGVDIIGFDVLANDIDVDGDTLSLASFDATNVDDGTLTSNGDGTFDYSPTDPNFFGTDSFTYVVTDGFAGDIGTVTIEVLDRNDPPVANPDSLAVTENTPNNPGNVLTNDTDDNNNITLVSFGASTHGTLTPSGNGDGAFSYTPNANVSGVTDTITYTINDGFNPDVTGTLTITIAEVNDPPVANPDGTATLENVATTLNVLANDTDPDGAALIVIAVTDGGKGTVVNNNNGTVTYTPNPSEFGTDTFTYTVSDSLGLTDVGTVTINISATNDRPTAVDDAGAGDEDTDITVDVLANDTDPDGDTLSIQIVSATNGSASGVTGDLVFTPDADFNGTAVVQYVANDGLALSNVATVTITVNPVNDNPDAIDDTFTSATSTAASPVTNVYTPLGNDLVTPDFGETLVITGADVASANGGTVTFDAGTVSFTPADDFEGIDTFDYSISDGNGGTDTATISVITSRQRYFRSGNNLVFIGLEDAADRVRVQALTNDTLNIRLRTDEGIFGPLPLGPGGVLQIFTFGGNDTVTSSALNTPLWVDGGTGNDILQGLTSADVLLGGPGNDIIQGGGNDDTMDGGTGNDLIVGRDGDEILIGGQGNDTLQGSSGSDVLWGGPGNDRLSGGSGSDYLDGGADNDTMVGGGGDDILLGRGGKDSLKGEAGNDVVIGGNGDDGVNGGKNQDALYGDEVTGDTAALQALLAAWAGANNDVSDRRDALVAAGVTISADGGIDNLIGHGGGDFFGDGENFVDFRSRNDIT